jgi:hypothetical protein
VPRGGWIYNQWGHVVGQNLRQRRGRTRYHDFTEAFLEELPKAKSMDQKLIDAGRKVWMGSGHLNAPESYRDRKILRKARRVLGLTEIQAKIADFYEVAVGFSPVEAAAMHVKHIRGEILVEKTVFDNDNYPQTVLERQPPSYQALKDYNSAVLPKPAKQVNIDQRTMVAKVMVEQQDAPKMRVRTIEHKAIETSDG